MDNRLIYTFLCSTKTCDSQHGKTVPVEGMKLVSALAHKYNIPVTWVVDSQSVREAKDIILQGHLECDDNIIVMIDPSVVFKDDIVPSSKAEEMVILRQRLPELIISEQKKIREMLPWAEANLIGAELKTSALVQVLEELDCIGLWGYRWDGDETDNITDRGCPWSFFYASRDHYNIPTPYSGKLVAMENSSFDLNAVFYSNNPHVFSANPSSLITSGLDLAYGKALLNEYLKNSSWNRFLVFMQQQSASDMEYASYDVYSRGTITKTADIMDSFFDEVASNPNIQALNLPQAVYLYRDEFEHTEACYMAFDSIVPPQIDINFYVPPMPRQKPPYPFTFFYYDQECQLIFREGQMTPVEVRNYAQPPFESKYYVEKDIPSISSFRPARDRDKLIMEFEIESTKRMPFGLTIWDDHSMFNLVSTNARLVKWIGTYLLFIRMDLEEGLNQIEISLTI